MGGVLRYSGDRPQNFAEDAPASRFSQDQGLVLPIFGFENINAVITPKPSNRQAIVFGADHDNLSVELTAFCLIGIDRKDIAVANRWLHGMSNDAYKAGISGIRAPSSGDTDRFRGRNAPKTASFVATYPVGACCGLQQRQSHHAGSLFTRYRRTNFMLKFQPQTSRRLFCSGRTAQRFDHPCGLDSSHLPKETMRPFGYQDCQVE